jgi:hypothetical protein
MRVVPAESPSGSRADRPAHRGSSVPTPTNRTVAHGDINSLECSARVRSPSCRRRQRGRAFCTRAGKFITARFHYDCRTKSLDLVPERLEEVARLETAPATIPSSPISSEPSGCQSSNPRVIHTNVGGGASHGFGPKPASNSSARGSRCRHSPQVISSPPISSQTCPTKLPSLSRNEFGQSTVF